MNLERKYKPEIHLSEKLDLKIPAKHVLGNGIELHHVNADHIDVIKLELVFEAGIWDQKKPLVALFVAQLLKEGSQSYNSMEVAENLDFYGAYLQCQHSHHYSMVTLFVLKKYLKHLLPVVESIVKEPVFDEKELNIALYNKKQEFIVESEKVKTLAVREFNKSMFGPSHPYANLLDIRDFDALNRNDLIAFHRHYYHAENCTVFLTGKLDAEVLSLIEQSFGKNWLKGAKAQGQKREMVVNADKKVFVAKDNAIQCGLRLGRKAVLKDHPDFHGLNILTTILGGYFGSRLMKNIREEKGYTYGIGANLLANKFHSVFTIQSEMATKNTLPVLTEIFKEFEILRTAPISSEELEMVRNYLLGELTRSFDGPFSRAESHLMLWMFGLDLAHVDQYVHTLNTITPSKLQALAIKWFDEKDWTVIAAGHPDLKKNFFGNDD